MSQISELDHLVYAGPDLDEAVGRVEELLGVRGTPGGVHLGLGTRNVLFSLGADRYLEVIGPDRAQGPPTQPRPFGIDGLPEPALVTWAVRPPRDVTIHDWADHLSAQQCSPGAVQAMSRERPDGVVLDWHLTRATAGCDGSGWLQPFLIDWGQTPHPAGDLPVGPGFRHLQIAAPRPDEIEARFEAMAVRHAVGEFSVGAPRLRAVVRTQRGDVELC